MNFNLVLESMGDGAFAVGHLPDGKVVFVKGGIIGDTVRASIYKEKPTYAWASLDEILEPSPYRVDGPACIESCGGCSWAHLAYEEQIKAKTSRIKEALKRVGHVKSERTEALVQPCIRSNQQWGYRNKVELAVANDARGRLQLGFYREGTHQLAPIQNCILGNSLIKDAPKALEGALRYLQGSHDLRLFRVGVRASERTKEIEIALWCAPGPFPRAIVAKALGQAIGATSIVRVIADPGRARSVKRVERLSGKGCWKENLARQSMLVSAPSFFQVNTEQTERMIALVLENLSLKGAALVGDLYAGAGTFTLSLAKEASMVCAVEAAGSAVSDLRRNLSINKMEAEVIGGDVARQLPELTDVWDFDAFVVDPPFSGLSQKVIKALLNARLRQLAYVSCNPQTWARDVARLEKGGYRLSKAIPVDMFPQTYHVETVSFFERRNH